MDNIFDIAEAWWKSFKPTTEEKETADKREAICKSCENYKELAADILPYCADCLCPIKKKIYATNKDTCPLKKWNI